MIQQRDEHRRHGGEVRRPEVANRGEHLLRLRTSGWMICSAPTRTPIIMHDRERVDMEVRDDDAGSARRRAGCTPDSSSFGLDDVREDVRVRQHRALRRAGRAAGVLQDREIVRRRSATRGRSAAVDRRRARSAIVERCPSTRGGAAPAAEYSASDVTMICSIARLRASRRCTQRRQRVERDHDPRRRSRSRRRALRARCSSG